MHDNEYTPPTPISSPVPPATAQVVLLSPEAKNPAKHVPRALFASLVAVTIVCAAASMSLSGAAAATDLDSDSAFAEAFRDRGMKAAYKVRLYSTGAFSRSIV